MTKLHFTLSAQLLLCATIGCTPRATSDAATPSEAGSPKTDGSGAAIRAEQPAKAIDFAAERYLLQRAIVRGTETVNEYRRPSETVAPWRQRITVTDSRGSFDLKAFVKAYTDTLNDNLAVNKDVYEYGTDSMIVYSYMVAADRTEITMLRAVLIPNLGIRSYLFVMQLPSGEKVNTADLTAKREIWMDQIIKLDVQPVSGH